MVAVKEKRWKQEREPEPSAVRVSETTERTFCVAVAQLFSDDMDDPSFSYFLSQNLEISSEGCSRSEGCKGCVDIAPV